jgi:hypothetical protein
MTSFKTYVGQDGASPPPSFAGSSSRVCAMPSHLTFLGLIFPLSGAVWRDVISPLRRLIGDGSLRLLVPRRRAEAPRGGSVASRRVKASPNKSARRVLSGMTCGPPAWEPASMMASIAFVTAMVLAAPSAALAQTAVFEHVGTPEQRREAIAACGHDARLFCRSLKEADGPYAYLACLEVNRRQLTASCVGLLVRFGQ